MLLEGVVVAVVDVVGADKAALGGSRSNSNELGGVLGVKDENDPDEAKVKLDASELSILGVGRLGDERRLDSFREKGRRGCMLEAHHLWGRTRDMSKKERSQRCGEEEKSSRLEGPAEIDIVPRTTPARQPSTPSQTGKGIITGIRSPEICDSSRLVHFGISPL